MFHVSGVVWAELMRVKEGWLKENAVSEEDKMAADRAKADADDAPYDPMQGLEGLDVAGPKAV